MSEENGSSSTWFRDTLFAIGLFIGIKLVFFNLIPYLLKNREAIGTEIAENVQDFESGIKLNSVAGDWKVYDYGKYSGNIISCNVQGRGISFSRKVINPDHEDFMKALSSTNFNLISEDPLIFEGTVLEKRESNAEYRRTKTRLTFDGETRLTISIWDDDPGQWKNITSKLYFDKD
jgi:hypothetical protein